MDFKPLITLLAIVNPLACVPFFIHYTQGFSRAQRQRTIWVSSFTAFVVIAASALLGLQILEFFGISLASFQVGGGMLLLTAALSMLNAQPAEARANADEVHDAEDVLTHLRRDWFDAVALSISSDRQLQALSLCMPRLREGAPNPQLHVMVGGPMAQKAPEALEALGVDLAAVDARQTVNWLSHQIMHRKS